MLGGIITKKNMKRRCVICGEKRRVGIKGTLLTIKNFHLSHTRIDKIKIVIMDILIGLAISAVIIYMTN